MAHLNCQFSAQRSLAPALVFFVITQVEVKMDRLFSTSSPREKIVVVGAGRSGIAACKLLNRFSQPVYLFDDKEPHHLRFFQRERLEENDLLTTCFGQKNIPD